MTDEQQAVTQREAHDQVLRWSHSTGYQIGRLRSARAEAIGLHRERHRRGAHTIEDNQPFYRLAAEVHFTLVAARQLVRALRAFDGNDRLPETLPNAHLRDLRDSLEHWDGPNHRAPQAMRDRGADPRNHQWSVTGVGVLGDTVHDGQLEQWAAAVWAELRDWDPWASLS